MEFWRSWWHLYTVTQKYLSWRTRRSIPPQSKLHLFAGYNRSVKYDFPSWWLPWVPMLRGTPVLIIQAASSQSKYKSPTWRNTIIDFQEIPIVWKSRKYRCSAVSRAVTGQAATSEGGDGQEESGFRERQILETARHVWWPVLCDKCLPNNLEH